MYPYYNNYAGFPQQMAQATMLKGRPVSSIEEVRAANIDFDGSLFVFPDVANKKIYTKQINLDGTAALKVYAQVNDTPPVPAYVTREEFDAFVKTLTEQKEVKANESKPTKPSQSSTITF